MTNAEAALFDNPAWSALTTGNRELAQGRALARRFFPEVSPFAVVADETAAAFAELAALPPPGEGATLVSVEPLAQPGRLVVERQAPVAQMVLAAPTPPAAAPASVDLKPADVADMLDLAGRTKPGPFGPRTIEFGRYIGLRIEGGLAAMAGERMRFGRFVEIGGVCVDPAHRGKGYAGLLIQRLASEMRARDLTAFLHVFADNTNAIGLYEKLGFVKRRTLFINGLRAAS